MRRLSMCLKKWDGLLRDCSLFLGSRSMNITALQNGTIYDGSGVSGSQRVSCGLCVAL